jgi:hypothetical protein
MPSSSNTNTFFEMLNCLFWALLVFFGAHMCNAVMLLWQFIAFPTSLFFCLLGLLSYCLSCPEPLRWVPYFEEVELTSTVVSLQPRDFLREAMWLNGALRGYWEAEDYSRLAFNLLVCAIPSSIGALFFWSQLGPLVDAFSRRHDATIKETLAAFSKRGQSEAVPAPTKEVSMLREALAIANAARESDQIKFRNITTRMTDEYERNLKDFAREKECVYSRRISQLQKQHQSSLEAHQKVHTATTDDYIAQHNNDVEKNLLLIGEKHSRIKAQDRLIEDLEKEIEHRSDEVKNLARDKAELVAQVASLQAQVAASKAQGASNETQVSTMLTTTTTPAATTTPVACIECSKQKALAGIQQKKMANLTEKVKMLEAGKQQVQGVSTAQPLIDVAQDESGGYKARNHFLQWALETTEARLKQKQSSHQVTLRQLGEARVTMQSASTAQPMTPAVNPFRGLFQSTMTVPPAGNQLTSGPAEQITAPKPSTTQPGTTWTNQLQAQPAEAPGTLSVTPQFAPSKKPGTFGVAPQFAASKKPGTFGVASQTKPAQKPTNSFGANWSADFRTSKPEQSKEQSAGGVSAGVPAFNYSAAKDPMSSGAASSVNGTTKSSLRMGSSTNRGLL